MRLGPTPNADLLRALTRLPSDSGNYGKDELLAFIELEGQATGTSYAAGEDSRAAFATDVRGSEWIIHGDTETGKEHWDFVRLCASSSLDTQTRR